MIHRWVFAACLLILTLCQAQAQDGGRIAGGEGVGPYRLGGDFSAIKAGLGTPDKVIESQEVAGTRFYVYKTLGLAFFVKGTVINGITVSSPRYATSQGLRVGRTRADVERVLGPAQSLRQTDVVYTEQGLGFQYDDQGTITHVQVIDKEARDALKGDLSIRPGERIGGIRIGMPVAQVVQTWGRPDKTGPLPTRPGCLLVLFQDKGIIVIEHDGRVEGVTSISPEYGTPDDLRVSSARRAVYKVYGSHPSVANDIEAYKEKGIGFTYENDKVTEITILPTH